jgi:hypothetical protein
MYSHLWRYAVRSSNLLFQEAILKTNEQFAMRRRAARVSQGRLARLTGISLNDICGGEVGNRDLSPAKIEMLRSALREELETTVEQTQQLLEQLTA